MPDIPVSPLAPVGGFPDLPIIKGVSFAVGNSGVKYTDRTDVMLASMVPGTTIAGVFTKSATRSAAVLDCQSKLANTSTGGCAILVNSGNANAFTGSHGQVSVAALTSEVARTLGIDQSRVFTASTGVIGETLPHQKIVDKLGALNQALSDRSAQQAARAIMTTDTYAKGAARAVNIDGTAINIAGFAKGSGMIAPDMATMLSYVFTDAAISQPVLQEMLATSVRTTFNSITVDSDTSTSDTLMLAATGTAEMAEISDVNSTAGAGFPPPCMLCCLIWHIRLFATAKGRQSSLKSGFRGLKAQPMPGVRRFLLRTHLW